MRMSIKFGGNMIVTERLVLKPYSDNDQKRMIELLTNKDIKKTFIIPDFDTQEDAVKMFFKMKDYSLSDEHYECGIYYNNNLIGWINDVDIKDDTIELGYVIDPQYSGRGFATEALQGAIKDLFDNGYNEVVAGAFASNKGSFKVMEKCGMKQIDKEEEFVYQGELQHCIYYSIRKN